MTANNVLSFIATRSKLPPLNNWTNLIVQIFISDYLVGVLKGERTSPYNKLITQIWESWEILLNLSFVNFRYFFLRWLFLHFFRLFGGWIIIIFYFLWLAINKVFDEVVNLKLLFQSWLLMVILLSQFRVWENSMGLWNESKLRWLGILVLRITKSLTGWCCLAKFR